ncbi:MAG: mechanosensitive ion channel domain-containing protein [Pseudomonadota bacterium]
MSEFSDQPVVVAITEFMTSLGFSPSELLSKWTLIQLGMIVTAYFVSMLLQKRIDEPIKARLRRLEGQRALLRILIVLQKSVFWLFLSIQLWVGFAILRASTWPSNSYIIRMAAELATAWLIISVMSRLIRNRAISRVVATIAWSIAALYILGFLPDTLDALDGAAFTVGGSRISVLAILKSSSLFVVFVWVALVLSQIFGNLITRNDDISPSVQVLLQKIIRFGLLVIAALFSLNVVGIDFTALAVFSGAVGIGIGLGLQKIVSNFLSGIILLLDKSIKPGDVIEIDTVSGSTYGWVQHLGARYTAVRTRDGTETLIPNETFIDSPVTNWTHSNTLVRRKLPVGVSYDTDVDKAIELCIEAAKSVDRVISAPNPVCLVKGFGDSSVDLELRFWLQDPEGGVANVSSQVYLEIWRRFKQNNIEIPFPQRDLNIRSSIPLEVRPPTSKT